jgi:hypothetical protein
MWVPVILLKGQGSHDLHFSQRGTKGQSNAYVRQYRKGLNPLFILFFSILSIPGYVPFFSPTDRQVYKLSRIVTKNKDDYTKHTFQIKTKETVPMSTIY